jgi:hypothetical protein
MSGGDPSFRGYLTAVLREYAALEQAFRANPDHQHGSITERERDALCAGAAARLGLDDETAHQFAARLRREWHQRDTIEMLQAMREQNRGAPNS